MQNEVIKLTDKDRYPELIGLLESKGEKIYEESKKWDPCYYSLKRVSEDDTEWSHTNYPTATITDIEFLAKYGNEKQPAWVFKSDEEITAFITDAIRFEKSTFLIHYEKHKYYHL
jgi:hypothetical protein